MPDDEKEFIDDEAVAEQDKDESNGFNTYLQSKAGDQPADERKDESAPDEKAESVHSEAGSKDEPETGDGVDGGKDAGEGDKPDVGNAGKPDGEDGQPDDQPTARNAVDRRLKELGIEEQPEKPVYHPPKPQVQPQVPGKRLTKEQIAEHLNSFTDEMFPEGEVVIGNETVDLADFKASWPDAYNAVKVMASEIAKSIVQKSGYVDKTTYDQGMQEQKTILAQLYFDRAVLRRHQDMDAILESKEWQEWLPKQSKGVREHLALSLDPEDGIKVLDLFKEDQARAKAAEFDKAAKDKKDKKDQLHSHTMRQKKTVEKPSGADENDESAGFNDYLSRKQ